ncbi:MAG: LON peptidase substrate-binding domain-containing protein [Gammaproteobacteria bacterium]|nr:LON peptidase substrate-binding domain-containing protein [Gammaproteobacteria bacterium]
MNAFDEAAGLIPLFPLHTVLFPDGLLPLQIFEPRYVDMVRTCMRQPCGFGVVGIKSGAEVGVASEVYQYGTLARIIDFSNTSAGLLAIVAHGTRRFKVIGREQRADNLLVGSVEWLPEEDATPVPDGFDDLAGAVREVARRAGQSPWQHTDFDDAVWLSWRLAELLPLATAARVELLSIDGAIQRLAMCRTMIEKGRDPNA